jgi:hypothetical protein
MNAKAVQQLLLKNKNDIAFVVGNGINRYNNTSKTISWEALLRQLWKKVTGENLAQIPNGISYTEFYDMLTLNNKKHIGLQQLVAAAMQDWAPQQHHKNIITSIKALQAPILTTNFDTALSQAATASWQKGNNKSFTDYYPWHGYYSTAALQNPMQGFGIWHINGLCKYPRSIRLGLTHYMGSVAKAKSYLQNVSPKQIVTNKPFNWQGHNSWLNLIFNKQLIFFGLALEENETFLRWLLIERKKYFNAVGNKTCRAWYIGVASELKNNTGKLFFLEQLGITPIMVADYRTIYEAIWP